MTGYEETLRRLAIRDGAYVEAVLAHESRNLEASGLDPKTHALVRIGALIAIGAAPPDYLCSVQSGLEHGATVEEIVGTLVAVMPSIGSGPVVAAAPKLGLAVGYDVNEALEQRDPIAR